MGISTYQTAYNILINGFSRWQESVINSCQFSEEVIIAVNASDDDTDSAIRDTLWEYKNWKIVPANFSRLDPFWDGRMKNLALQHCTQEFKIQKDLDEEIPLWQKPLWDNKLFQLKFSGAKVMAVPSVDLYCDEGHYKSINPKTYVNIGQAYRGPSANALKPGYFINTQFSDGTELIDEKFNLLPAIISGPCNLAALESCNEIFVVHYGYLNIQERIERTKKFWADHWLQESNGTLPAHKIHNDETTFSHYEYKLHNLKLT
jgi:hypothetical protein